MIQAVLDRLAVDLGALSGVNHAQVWQGEWDALESGGRISFQVPAVFVSLVEFSIVHVAQTVRGRGRLAAYPAPPPPPEPGEPPPEPDPRRTWLRGRGPAAFTPDGGARATADVEIAVTCVAGGPSASGRAETALELATRTVPVLVSHALRNVAASNLDSTALRGRGQSAVVLVGTREVQLDPPAGDQQTLTRVDFLSGQARETVFEEG